MPQHHMRLFAGNPKRIALVTRASGAIIPSASIRHQCARHMFYGDPSVEDALSRIETRHALAYRAAVALAWESGPALTPMQLYNLREALILQRARTPAHAAISASSMDQATLHLYLEHLKSLPRSKRNRELIRAIESDRVRLRHSRAFALQAALSTVHDLTPLAQDLVLRVLRNRTSTPFLLGTAPSVYSNHYQREVTAHGVLGITSQGLMVAMPLNATTYLIAYDPGKYRFRGSARVVDIDLPDDVMRLNRLQAFATGECLYFAQAAHAEDAVMILSSCPQCQDYGRGGFQLLTEVEGEESSSDSPKRTYRPIAVGEDDARGDIIMMFERQLPETLELSVFETADFEGIAAAYPPRCQHLVDRFEPRDLPGYGKPTGIDQLVELVESQMETW